MLDQIALSRAVDPHILQQLAHHGEQVIAGKDLLARLASTPLVLLLDDLSIVFNDLGEAASGQDLLPQIVCCQPGRIGWVARAVVIALVEGEKPGVLALEMGAEAHLVVIHREMHHAAPELEQQLLRITVALVLLHRVRHRLLRQAVLEFDGRDRQTIDEDRHVQRQPGLVA